MKERSKMRIKEKIRANWRRAVVAAGVGGVVLAGADMAAQHSNHTESSTDKTPLAAPSADTKKPLFPLQPGLQLPFGESQTPLPPKRRDQDSQPSRPEKDTKEHIAVTEAATVKGSLWNRVVTEYKQANIEPTGDETRCATMLALVATAEEPLGKNEKALLTKDALHLIADPTRHSPRLKQLLELFLATPENASVESEATKRHSLGNMILKELDAILNPSFTVIYTKPTVEDPGTFTVFRKGHTAFPSRRNLDLVV